MATDRKFILVSTHYSRGQRFEVCFPYKGLLSPHQPRVVVGFQSYQRKYITLPEYPKYDNPEMWPKLDLIRFNDWNEDVNDVFNWNNIISREGCSIYIP